MSELLFIADVSHKSGIGHLMRCLALAQAAQQRGLESVFFVSHYGQDVALSRHDWCGRLVLADFNSDSTIAVLKGRIASQHCVGLVVDGYCFEHQFIAKLGELPIPLLMLDDLKAPVCEHADIIVNPAASDWLQEYRMINSRAQLCLGARYRLLRREFMQIPILPVSKRQSLTINFGGSDPMCFTLPVLEILTKRLPNIPFRVVTGPGYSQLDSLRDFIAQSCAFIQHIHNCQDMADLWTHSRLTVAAAGGVQFELCACQCPSVLIVVADNQYQATKKASEQGWCEILDARSGIDETSLIKTVSALWNNDVKLADMQVNAEKWSYVSGADNVLDTLATYVQVCEEV
ncbi:UDP-2,4-diacetamido-2,4,6-trideoxy-beta-L-altropyranose hydrolase [Alteromonas sp. Mex14]|nr:UDP-2,4-diacetamido-2,4,6-trideoxy-beta-L-altropyranose hydrolase [Alteromonas sp. Mex14]